MRVQRGRDATMRRAEARAGPYARSRVRDSLDCEMDGSTRQSLPSRIGPQTGRVRGCTSGLALLFSLQAFCCLCALLLLSSLPAATALTNRKRSPRQTARMQREQGNPMATPTPRCERLLAKASIDASITARSSVRIVGRRRHAAPLFQSRDPHRRFGKQARANAARAGGTAAETSIEYYTRLYIDL